MIDLRWATHADAALLLRFIRALADYEREPDAVRVTEQTLARQLADEDPPFECLIASLDGEPAGFALFFRNYSTWLGQSGIWLEDLFVLPEARRRGVGRALLQRLAAIAEERACGRLEWSVLEWNQPAIEFYATLGAKLMDEWRICRVTGAGIATMQRITRSD
jgi:GNAT superfamily N-acetyltransferase